MSRGDLRAVFVDHAPVLGGAERSLLLLAERLPSRGVRTDVVTGSARLAPLAIAAGASVDLLDLPRLRGAIHPVRVATAAWKLRRRLSMGGPTVAIANTARAAAYLAAATRQTHVPFVWYARDLSLVEGAPGRPRADAAARRALQAAACCTIAVSHAVAATLPSPARLTVVHNGVALPPAPANGSALRRQWRLPADAPVVGTVGRLRPWKAQDRFLRAMAAVARARPDACFVVAGSGGDQPDLDYERRLRRLAAVPELDGRVTFCGWVNDPASVHGAFDVLVHAGDPEPFGLAVVEAMSHAVPVIGFAHGALPELIDHGRTGVLVPPGDVDRLALAVTTVLGDPEWRARIGAAGRRAAAERFDADVTADRVAAILRRVGRR